MCMYQNVLCIYLLEAICCTGVAFYKLLKFALNVTYEIFFSLLSHIVLLSIVELLIAKETKSGPYRLPQLGTVWLFFWSDSQKICVSARTGPDVEATSYNYAVHRPEREIRLGLDIQPKPYFSDQKHSHADDIQRAYAELDPLLSEGRKTP